MTTNLAIRYPGACPVCASRRLAVWQHDGSWACRDCDTDSDDTEASQPAESNR